MDNKDERMTAFHKIKDYLKSNVLDYGSLEENSFHLPADSRQIRHLYNKFQGEKCVIIGNGPSLNKCDLGLIQNEFTFGVNGIFYKYEEVGFKPTFYVVEDPHVMRDNVQEINDFECEYRFFPRKYRKYIKNRKNTSFFRLNEGYYVDSSPNYKIPRFSTEFDRILYCGQSVTILNLQIAYYLGFSEVYLIGMDFDYKIPESAIVDGNNILSNDSDENHFHPDYFGKGKSWHDPKLDRVLNSYRMVKLVYEISGRKIYNSTVGGKLELFDRVDYYDVF